MFLGRCVFILSVYKFVGDVVPIGKIWFRLDVHPYVKR